MWGAVYSGNVGSWVEPGFSLGCSTSKLMTIVDRANRVIPLKIIVVTQLLPQIGMEPQKRGCPKADASTNRCFLGSMLIGGDDDCLSQAERTGFRWTKLDFPGLGPSQSAEPGQGVSKMPCLELHWSIGKGTGKSSRMESMCESSRGTAGLGNWFNKPRYFDGGNAKTWAVSL